MTLPHPRKAAFRTISFIFFVHAVLVCFVPAVGLSGDVFRLGSYNVENLFDLEYSGSEYPGYIPGGKFGWDRKMLARKAENISRVIADLDAHVVALQEVESMAALGYLQDVLRQKGVDYPWAAVTGKDDTAVRCALLSRFPIVESADVAVPGRGNRNILKATIDIDNTPLVVFVNHWRSRNAPESSRVAAAKSLMEAVAELPPDTDYILAGDFNSNYNEFEIIRRERRINDTGGKTGINHILGTLYNDHPAKAEHLLRQSGNRLHYNPWQELVESRRFSYLFSGRKRTLDHILLPAAMFDDAGISYLAGSFDKFDPHYLFEGGRIFRWQRENRGRGRHKGEGFSDHLPVYACFILETDGLLPADDFGAPCSSGLVPATISQLYESRTGGVRYEIENAALIYREGDNAVIKRPGGRAVYVYGAAAALERGRYYTLIVDRLKRFYGNLQVTGIESASPAGVVEEMALLLVNDPEADLSDPAYENEVVSSVAGCYDDGWLNYADSKSIRVFFRDEAYAPVDGSCVVIENARIGLHRHPQLVVEENTRIRNRIRAADTP